MITKICLNYDSNIITINSDKENINIPISKKNSPVGKKIFKNGAYWYIGLLEYLLFEMYPAEVGKTLSPRLSGFSENHSKLVSDLNCVLPDFLKINGTRAFNFMPEINNKIIHVEVIASKEKSKENRNIVDKSLSGINWEQKNRKIDELYNISDISNNISETEISWDEEELISSFHGYKTERFDKSLLTPIKPYGRNLHEYIHQTLISHTRSRICMLVGEGGFGKTTSIRYSAEKLYAEGHIPIIVCANELQKEEQEFITYIAKRYTKGTKVSREKSMELMEHASHKQKLFVFIDGVDELPAKYYKQLIGHDICVLKDRIPNNLYFIISTRQSASAFARSVDIIETEIIVAEAGNIDLTKTDLDDNYKALLANYPQFKTPLFISTIKSIMSDAPKQDADNDYGYLEKNNITNKTQLFDAWITLRATHADKLGMDSNYYTYVLTLIAYESLMKYMNNGDLMIPRKEFDVESISQKLEMLGGRIRSKIDLGYSTDSLIKAILGTGLIETADNEFYKFVNMEYLLYLAAYYVSLLFIQKPEDQARIIDVLLSISSDENNHNLSLVSYPEFAFNRIMDYVQTHKAEFDDNKKGKLLELGLAIGSDKTRDVDDNLYFLMDWFKEKCDYSTDSAGMAWRFHWPLYNMIAKWRFNPKEAEDQLSKISGMLDWLSDYLGQCENASLPIDYEANLLGNKGAVEQEFAKCESKKGNNRNNSVVSEHLMNALTFHNKAFLKRQSLAKQAEYDKRMITGLARNTISLSTDIYYLSQIDEYEEKYRAQLLFIGLYGGEGPHNITIPGFKHALDLQGSFDVDSFKWYPNKNSELSNCEPCLIFRRMAGNCCDLYKLVGAHYGETDVVKSFLGFFSLAANELSGYCAKDENKAEINLELFRKEISDFVEDISHKFLELLRELRKTNRVDEDVLDDAQYDIKAVLEAYNKLHNAMVRLDKRKLILKNF